MPDYFLYLGERGVSAWLELSCSEDFGVASRLTRLLEQNRHELGKLLPGSFEMVSVGVGDGVKERLLLLEVAPGRDLAYSAVDASYGMVERALEAVSDIGVALRGFVALMDDLKTIRERCGEPVLLCFLGNNFCNYHPAWFFKVLEGAVRREDMLLFDAGIVGDEETASMDRIEAEYMSSANAEFNLGPLLQRGIPREDLEFHLELIPADTPVGTALRTRKWIEFLSGSSLEVAGREIRFSEGDRIEMGFTYKYRRAQVERLLEASGWKTTYAVISPGGTETLVLARH